MEGPHEEFLREHAWTGKYTPERGGALGTDPQSQTSMKDSLPSLAHLGGSNLLMVGL